MEFTGILAARSHSLWPVFIFGLIVVAALIAGDDRRAATPCRTGSVRADGWGCRSRPGRGAARGSSPATRPSTSAARRRSSNLLEGTRNGVRWAAFDYRYSTGSGKNRRTHHWGVVLARVELSFPRAIIRPEGFLDSIASLAGFDDINFESEAFSRHFHVSAVGPPADLRPDRRADDGVPPVAAGGALATGAGGGDARAQTVASVRGRSSSGWG